MVVSHAPFASRGTQSTRSVMSELCELARYRHQKIAISGAPAFRDRPLDSRRTSMATRRIPTLSGLVSTARRSVTLLG